MWLRGLEYAPKKLQRIARLNTLLAHQPWKINAADIRELVKGVSNRNRPQSLEPIDNWTTSEVVLAMCILSYYHAQASLVSGCGVVPEVDTPGGTIDSFKNSHLPISHILSTTSSFAKEEGTNIEEILGGKGYRNQLSGISLLSRKRQQLGNTERNETAPDKWLKTPQGSVHSSNPNTAASSRTSSPQK